MQMFSSPKRKRLRRAGILVEAMAGVLIGAMVIGGVASLMIGQIRGTAHIDVSLDAASQAAAAVRLMNTTLEEAKSVTLVSPTHITAYFPVVQSDGTYNKTTQDPNSGLGYYLGSVAGGPNANSTTLIQQQANGQRRVICSNVSSLVFTLPLANTLIVTIGTSESVRNFKGIGLFLTRQITLRNN